MSSGGFLISQVKQLSDRKSPEKSSFETMIVIDGDRENLPV